jgi:hypothetical protein
MSFKMFIPSAKKSINEDNKYNNAIFLLKYRNKRKIHITINPGTIL